MTPHKTALRSGWTTGACATAATKAAAVVLLRGEPAPDPVTITLPRGQTPAFALACVRQEDGAVTVGVVKDAGDDPDVTHGALILATLRRGAPGSGVTFCAGPGVGTVTRPGLPIPPGEPAINPVPRAMMRAVIAEVAGEGVDVEITVSIENGEALAQKTLNPRLGIVGGLSVLGTTGIVVPYSCAAWIDTIHRGIDVARALGLDHVAGSTGSTSEAAIQARHGLHEAALIDMGDFVGGMLKYLRRHPVARVSIAGGIGKMTKLAQGLLDLHSKRGSVDLDRLAELSGLPQIAQANTALEAFSVAQAAGVPLGDTVAAHAWTTAAAVLEGTDTALEVVIFDRQGHAVGHAPFRAVGLNRRS